MSKIDKARRGFLKLLPAAPFGAAAAAKEAAASMGLSGPIGAGNMLMGGQLAGYANSSLPSSDGHWIASALKRFNDHDTVLQAWEQAKQNGRILDPDIAAMRSLSPAQAYHIQVQRCFDKYRAREKAYLNREFDEWAKNNPGASIAKAMLG